MVSPRVADILPEWEAFVRAVQARQFDAGTWCEAWTTRDILAHQTAIAEELSRVLSTYLAGKPVATRGRDREKSFHELSGLELWSAFITRCEELTELIQTAMRDLAPDEKLEWASRTVTPGFFADHMRQELILHRWDLTGDDVTAHQALAETWITEHTVREVGKPLLRRGAADLDLGADGYVEGRLRAPGTDDVVVTATPRGYTIEFARPEGPATIESDSAVRNLLLWGRRPADSSRWQSDAGPEKLKQLRTLLSGY